MAVVDAYVFPGFLTPVLEQLFFPKPPTTFLTCFCRGKRRKYASKKVRLNGDQTHNHQVISLTRSPLNHTGGAPCGKGEKLHIYNFLILARSPFPKMFHKYWYNVYMSHTLPHVHRLPNSNHLIG